METTLVAILEDESLNQLFTASQPMRVSVREDGDNARKPSFAIAQVGQAPRVHFAGIPMGHEFTSLVMALLQVRG